MNSKNELVKRKFQKFLQEAEGRTESTVDKYLRAIARFEIVNNYIDFKNCNEELISNFKTILREQTWNDNTLSPLTARSYLIYLQKFFRWLIQQPGYHTLLRYNIPEFFNPSRKENMIAASTRIKDYPTLEYVIKLCSSIILDDSYARRDQALIAFAFLSGARIDSIISLSMKCFDPDTLTIDMDPLNSVRTKFSKHIRGELFNFNEELVRIVLDWYEYLVKIGFDKKDPLFPKTSIVTANDSLSFCKRSNLLKDYWADAGGARKIFSRRAKEANLKSYSPHLYRHGCFKHIAPFIISGDQIKAVSQTFGHESIKTILQHYGNYDDSERIKILTSINFLQKSITVENDRKILEITKIINGGISS